MLFQVTSIEFDFDLDDDEIPVSDEYKEAMVDSIVGDIWEAEDEDDLLEEITAATGWCILNVDYRHVLV